MPEHPTPDGSDPLDAFTGLFLQPRAIRSPLQASKAYQPCDLDSVHQAMKDMGLRNAEMLIEESKAIVASGSEQLLNANFLSFKSLLRLDDHVGSEGEKDKVGEQRTGLGRKKPQFSMKPYASQPTVITLGSSVDVEQITNPEEYFIASMKLENAQQEIKKQLGIVDDDFNINSLPANTRRSRQPLRSGRTGKFKHLYPLPSAYNDVVISSQDRCEVDDVCAPKSNLQQKRNSQDAELQEPELVGLITEQENRVNLALDKLLSHDFKEFKGDTVLSLLQEEMQLKPIDFSALCVPDLPAPKIDNLMPGVTIPRASKSVLGSQNTDKRTNSERQRKDLDNNSNLAGPMKTLSESGKLYGEYDIYQELSDLDLSPSDNHTYRSTKRNVLSVNTDTSHHEYRDQIRDHEGHTDAGQIDTRGLEILNEQPSENNSGGETTAFGQREAHGTMGQHNEGNHMDIRSDDGHSSMQNRDTDVQGSGDDCTHKDVCTPMQELSPAQVEVDADDTSNTSNEMETDFQKNLSFQMDKHTDDMQSAFSAEQDHNTDDAYISKDSASACNPSNPSKSDASQGHPMDMQSVLPPVSHTSPGQHIMKHPAKKVTRKNSPCRRERKSLRTRKSFADAGTSFEDGVRRSKRIKTRPLEFWKGERLIFGRVNDSMKLIGVKYLSPTVGNIKVKSYISDEFKEVIEKAARH
ncbi:unnamed protein product [Cuscuta campestris]|uniref:Centromere protein C n=1 Tax=Cuscuta campestris TaxID=132261 RepID=A0A484KVW3_9ASTE|nr:unnamed protein product [Cuscuta campestris]